MTESVATAAFGRKPPPEGASSPKRVPYRKKRMGLCWVASAFLLLARVPGTPGRAATRPGTTSAHWETPNLNRQDGGLWLWPPLLHVPRMAWASPSLH